MAKSQQAHNPMGLNEELLESSGPVPFDINIDLPAAVAINSASLLLIKLGMMHPNEFQPVGVSVPDKVNGS